MAKNIKFYFAIFLLFFWIALAIFAPMIAPYDPQYVDLSLKLLDNINFTLKEKEEIIKIILPIFIKLAVNIGP